MSRIFFFSFFFGLRPPPPRLEWSSFSLFPSLSLSSDLRFFRFISLSSSISWIWLLIIIFIAFLLISSFTLLLLHIPSSFSFGLPSTPWHTSYWSLLYNPDRSQLLPWPGQLRYSWSIPLAGLSRSGLSTYLPIYIFPPYILLYHYNHDNCLIRLFPAPPLPPPVANRPWPKAGLNPACFSPALVGSHPFFSFLLSVSLPTPPSLPSLTTSECQLQFNGVWYATWIVQISVGNSSGIYWWCWTAIPSILKDIKSLSRLMMLYGFPYRIWPLIRTPFFGSFYPHI